MTNVDQNTKVAAAGFPNRAAVWRDFLLVAAIFLLQAGLLVPEVNEPNYLAKAKNYWNADWCRGDFFLQSADAHLVFYWMFGWTTLFLPLPYVALLGRLLTYVALAFGWQRLSWAVVPRPYFAAFSAALAVAFNYRFHMAGEWFVGGLEAKGFAYALVFLGLAWLASGRWNRAWIALGGATALHVLVGGWSFLVAAAVWLATSRDPTRPALRSMLTGLSAGVVVALFGLVPALLLTQDVPPEIAAQANKIQVYERLPHHLNPAKFFVRSQPPFLSAFGFRFALMSLCWFVVSRRTPGAALRNINRFVLGSLWLAIAGLIIALAAFENRSLGASLLRFYWFRLADVMIPVGAALTASSLLAASLPTRLQRFRRVPAWGLAFALAFCVWDLGMVTWHRWQAPAPPADLKMLGSRKKQEILNRAEYHRWVRQRYRDWLDICRIAKEHTAADAIFLTPRTSHTFKWYAERGEVATWKEVPQDARSLVDWWNRIRLIHRAETGGRNPFDEMTAVDLRQLGQRLGAGYLVTDAESPLDLPLVRRNSSFAIYRLTTQASSVWANHGQDL